MARKKQIVEDTATDNASTVAMKPNKANAMAQAVTLLASLSGDEINKLVSVLQQNSASAAASIPDDAAAKNAASIAMKEELETIFGGEELAEEFKEKVSTLFEAAVTTRVQLELTEATERFEQTLAEQTQIITEQLIDQTDKYLSYVAEEWMKANEIAVESSIRTEIAEQFIEGLKELFKEHYIEIPDDRIDVVESYAERVEQLEEQLNESLAKNIELEEAMDQFTMEEAFEEVSEGLAMTQVEKFRTLAEGVEYTGDLDTYKRKLNIIKENHFKKKAVSTKSADVLEESFEGGEESVKNISPIMQRYLTTISRTTKK